jgi:hypothetical protein
MSSMLKTAWRVVVRRAGSDWAILAAVFTTTVLAVALMAAGPIYADATTSASLRRTLVDAPIEDSSLVIETRAGAATFDVADEQVTSAIEESFSSIGVDLFRRGTSDSYGIQGLDQSSETDLAVFRTYSGLESRAELLEGRWPATGSNPIEIAVPAVVGEQLAIEASSRFEVASRAGSSDTFQVQVTGIYEVMDATDPYWLNDPLDLDGAIESTSFTTHGPFVVTVETYFSTVARGSAKIRWSAFPHHDQIEVEDMRGIVRGIGALDARLNTGRDIGNQMQIVTGLDGILRDTERALLVTRSAVLTVSIQLAVLAGYALLLAAGLLADTREIESSTMRSRGASTGQLVMMAAMEGLLLAIPALIIGPPLAAFSLRAFNLTGPLAGIGLGITPLTSANAWLLAGLAALGCVVALVVPAYLATRRSGSVRARRSREPSGALRQTGIDVALVLVAALGVWQLSRYGASLTSTVRGRLGIDPLLVAAPALALLAGSILALRVLPLIARIAEGTAGRSRRLTGPLGIWHLSRQPRRYSRSALMLILALAIGVFAVTYESTWRISQQDQAAFDVGADLSIYPSQRAGDSIPPQFLTDAYRRVSGHRGSAAALRSGGAMFGVEMPVEFLMIDAGVAGDVVGFRPDQASRPLGELMAELESGRPTVPGIEIPGRPSLLAVTAGIAIEPPELQEEVDISTIPTSLYAFEPTLRAVLMDSRDISFRLDLGNLSIGGGPVEMRSRLTHPVGEEGDLRPEYPLRLVGFEVRGLAPFNGLGQDANLTISEVASSANGSIWTPLDLNSSSPTTEVSDLRLADEVPTIAVIGERPIVARIFTGSTAAQSRQAVYHAIWMGELPALSTIPVLTGDTLAETLDLEVGDPIPLDDLPDVRATGTIVGRVSSFPTVDPGDSHPVILDLATYHALVLGPGSFPPPPTSYWVDLVPGTGGEAATQLLNPPFDSEGVLDLEDETTELILDPVSLGTIGSLLAGLVAATILAGIGFLVNVVVSGRDREGQFALMKAVGLKTKEVRRWVGVENGITVLFAIVCGVLLGLGLAALILPLTAITQEATVVTPPLEVVIPWPAVAGMTGIVLALLFAAGMIVTRMVKRLSLASLLRAGDD